MAGATKIANLSLFQAGSLSKNTGQYAVMGYKRNVLPQKFQKLQCRHPCGTLGGEVQKASRSKHDLSDWIGLNYSKNNNEGLWVQVNPCDTDFCAVSPP